jgi:hypothetical protein
VGETKVFAEILQKVLDENWIINVVGSLFSNPSQSHFFLLRVQLDSCAFVDDEESLGFILREKDAVVNQLLDLSALQLLIDRYSLEVFNTRSQIKTVWFHIWILQDSASLYLTDAVESSQSMEEGKTRSLLFTED